MTSFKIKGNAVSNNPSIVVVNQENYLHHCKTHLNDSSSTCKCVLVSTGKNRGEGEFQNFPCI